MTRLEFQPAQSIMKKTNPALLSLVAAMTLPLAAAAADQDTRCYELRTYYANEGKLDALNARFRNHTVALFEKHGMTNVGYWVPLENDANKLVYLMAYPSREARGTMWKAFFNDPNWKAAYQASVANGKLVKRVDSLFLKATDYSMFTNPAKADKERVFELRTYTTNEGKLDGLNARFRDHTVALFEKHGIENIGYWTPMDSKHGRDNKLIYLIAHKSVDGRKAAFGAFGKDPKWQAARKASEVNGRLLVRKGVQSLMLKPTGYSPMK